MEKLKKELIYQVKVLGNGIETGSQVQGYDTQGEIGHQTFDEYYVEHKNKYFKIQFFDEIIDKVEYEEIYKEWVEYEEVTKAEYAENILNNENYGN